MDEVRRPASDRTHRSLATAEPRIVPFTGGGPAVRGVPLSTAILAGGFVFVSGQVGINPDTGAMAAGIREQTAAALANIERVLAEAGVDRTSVVRTTVYLTDVSEFGAMNDTYRTFFTGIPPARTTVGIAGLAIDGLRIEIDAIALGPRVRGESL